MKYKKIRKILTSFLILFGFIILFDVASFIGAGGILNEMDQALMSIEKLEKENHLNKPPENISNNTKYYLSQFHNSSELKRHIKDYETKLYYRDVYSYICISLFFISLILRVYFRKAKIKELIPA